MDNLERYTKVVNHEVLDKFDYICFLNLTHENFGPFREVIGYGQHETMSFRRRWGDRSDNVHSLDFKRPTYHRCIQVL